MCLNVQDACHHSRRDQRDGNEHRSAAQITVQALTFIYSTRVFISLEIGKLGYCAHCRKHSSRYIREHLTLHSMNLTIYSNIVFHYHSLLLFHFRRYIFFGFTILSSNHGFATLHTRAVTGSHGLYSRDTFPLIFSADCRLVFQLDPQREEAPPQPLNPFNDALFCKDPRESDVYFLRWGAQVAWVIRSQGPTRITLG